MTAFKRRLIAIHQPADEWLKQQASKRGIPINELVRRIIDRARNEDEEERNKGELT